MTSPHEPAAASDEAERSAEATSTNPQPSTFNSRPTGSAPGHDAIRRTVELDTTLDHLWSLLSTTDGLASWLVDSIDVEMTPGSIGSVEEGGVRRTIRIDERRDGEGVGFTWWRDDDPDDISTVRIDLEGRPDGSSRVHIVEQPVGATGASGSSAWGTDPARRHTWEVRVLSLWACTVAMALVQ